MKVMQLTAVPFMSAVMVLMAVSFFTGTFLVELFPLAESFTVTLTLISSVYMKVRRVSLIVSSTFTVSVILGVDGVRWSQADFLIRYLVMR